MQGKQAASDMEPEEGWKVPRGHLVQEEAPGVEEKKPGLHERQGVEAPDRGW